MLSPYHWWRQSYGSRFTSLGRESLSSWSTLSSLSFLSLHISQVVCLVTKVCGTWWALSVITSVLRVLSGEWSIKNERQREEGEPWRMLNWANVVQNSFSSRSHLKWAHRGKEKKNYNHPLGHVFFFFSYFSLHKISWIPNTHGTPIMKREEE